MWNSAAFAFALGPLLTVGAIFALFLAAGHGVRFRDVADRPRRGGRSKYGVLDRLWVGLGDLIGVFWRRRRLLIPPPMKETADGR